MPSTAPTMTQAVQLIWPTIPTQTPPLPASLWLEEVPEDIDQLPIAQYVHQGEPPGPQAYCTSATKPGYLLGQFLIALYDLSVPNLETWARAIMTVMNTFIQSGFPIDTPQAAYLLRKDYRIEATDLRDAAGNPVRKLTLYYQCFISNPAA